MDTAELITLLTQAAYSCYPGIIIRDLNLVEVSVTHGLSIRCTFSHWEQGIESQTVSCICPNYADAKDASKVFLAELGKYLTVK